MTGAERLVYMANQIARNFEAIGHDHAVAATADHIAHFWDPRMRRIIFEMLDAGGEGMSPLTRAALKMLKGQGAPAPQTRATRFSSADGTGRSDAG